MKKILWILALFFAVLAAGCAAQQTAQPTEEPVAESSGDAVKPAPVQPAKVAVPAEAAAPAKVAVSEPEDTGPACPLEDKANKVTLKDVSGGIAIEVRTTGDASALRAQMVARLAYKKAHKKAKPKIQTETKLVDILGGFKRVIIARDPADIEKLRAHVRKHLAEERGE